MNGVPNKELLLQYTRDLLLLKGIQITLAELLVEVLRKANYDNQIILNATIKKELGERLGCSIGTVDNALTRFVNEGLLLRMGRGVYQPNEQYFWKRGEEDQIDSIRLIIDYAETERNLFKNFRMQDVSEMEKEM